MTRTFSTDYKHHFSRILALTRDVASATAKELASLDGVEVLKVSFEEGPTSLVDLLRGVDIVINTLGSGAASGEKDVVAEAAVEVNARVYFPSEFGVCAHFRPCFRSQI